MLANLAIAFCLLALTVITHAVGLALMMQRPYLLTGLADTRFRARTWILVRIAAWVVAIHWTEVSIWAVFYWWQNCLPNFETALYFSIVTYTTVGYGDVVLSQGWRLLAGVEALTGILMCSWSTGFFFTIVSRFFQSHAEPTHVNPFPTPAPEG